MPPTGRLYYAYLAEPAPLGERRPRAPAHLTLVPPFTATIPDAREVLGDALPGCAPFEVHAAGSAAFGRRRDVPVVLIEPVAGLRDLHERLIGRLEARALRLVDDRHVHDDFAPHIRVRPRDPGFPVIPAGRSFTVDHVALLRSGDGATTVVATEPLPG